MARTSAVAQDHRSLNNPLNLGTFSSTSLRYLKGSLGPKNKIVGYADTNQLSNGGFGEGAYTNWFSITITNPAWIIIAKGDPRPQYIQTSTYDLNKNPIQGEAIFDADSVIDGLKINGEVYIPYLDTMMSAQSDLYNTFIRSRLDRGDERYYPLEVGSYLICISTTRNEPLDYEVGIVVEFPVTEMFVSVEDTDEIVYFLQETAIDYSRTINVASLITTNTTVSSDVNRPNGFTETECTINATFTVTVLSNSTWFIGTIPSSQDDDFKVIIEPGEESSFAGFHDHSLTEWRNAWENQHQSTDVFPELFASLTNRL